jgi:hypothetical protein
MDLKQVKALYMPTRDQAVFCDVEIAVWDSATDYAYLTITAPYNHSALFNEYFWIDNQIPGVGDEVAMIGYGEMRLTPNNDDPATGIIQRRLVVRVGRVETVCQTGDMLLKGPWIQTSIPVFFGMSGGIVARWTGPGTRIQPFGIISHDLELTQNRSESGRSIGAVLQVTTNTLFAEGVQHVVIPFTDMRVGRSDQDG